jgi:hypothetical protein
MVDQFIPTRVVPAQATPSTPVGTAIRFFLSSTFADFKSERNILQESVLPELQQQDATSGYRLHPVDLHWGVSQAASTDWQTLRICFDVLERCRQPSPACFLLIQLGTRYGSYILPPSVLRSLAERLLAHLSPEEQARFNAAYRLDETAVPPAYVLLRAKDPERAEDEILRVALVRAGQSAGVGEEERLLFDGSATHREIQLRLLGQPRDGGLEASVLCAVRMFDSALVGSAAETYAVQDAERAARIDQLTQQELGRVPSDQVLRYAVQWNRVYGPVVAEEAIAQAYLRLLRPTLEAVIAARTAAWEAASRGYNQVALANATFATDELRQALADYLDAPARVPLVLAGLSGSGKSTLLAHVAENVLTTRPEPLILARYVSVTPGTANMGARLEGMCTALASAYSHEIAPAHKDYERARAVHEELGWATVERYLILRVDALDPLGPALVTLDQLPEMLPQNVHLIVSILDEPDRPEPAILQARAPAPMVIPLDRMGAAEANELLTRWLAEAGRTLQPAQHMAMLDAFAQPLRPLDPPAWLDRCGPRRVTSRWARQRPSRDVGVAQLSTRYTSEWTGPAYQALRSHAQPHPAVEPHPRCRRVSRSARCADPRQQDIDRRAAAQLSPASAAGGGRRTCLAAATRRRSALMPLILAADTCALATLMGRQHPGTAKAVASAKAL